MSQYVFNNVYDCPVEDDEFFSAVTTCCDVQIHVHETVISCWLIHANNLVYTQLRMCPIYTIHMHLFCQKPF